MLSVLLQVQLDIVLAKLIADEDGLRLGLDAWRDEVYMIRTQWDNMGHGFWCFKGSFKPKLADVTTEITNHAGICIWLSI